MNPIIVIIIGTSVVMLGIVKLKLHPVISLLLAALVTGLLTTPGMLYNYAVHSGMPEAKAIALSKENIGDRLATAFGNTSAKIGILIALASIIGTALMRSGGAERIIRSFLGIFGKKNAGVSLSLGSFILGIPVFFDTVFYLMIPLVKSLSIRHLKKFSLYLMAIIAGGVMSHSLVPPTPGPLFVARELKVDLGVMMIAGIVVGLITVAAGFVYAIWANKKWDLPMRSTIDMTNEDLEQFSARKNEELPSLWFSLLPIVLPIVLITANTFSSMGSAGAGNISGIKKIFSVIGDANIALFISCCVAMLLLWKSLKNKSDFSKYITEALTSAGVIILITAAGGAFGQMLQQTGIGIKIGELASRYQMAILPMAFIITAIVRTAQGSATVAMVTAIGVMSGTVTDNLQFHPVYLALAIGCGSKVFAWMNDSAFWIISKMSGMDVKETVKYFSYLLVVMAVTGLIVVMILSQLFPMV
jgi:gluconate:H+ symporter, GntP family